MSVVSNLFGFGDPPHAGEVVCRPARREELHRGLRIVLGNDGRNASDGEVLDFLRSAVHRRIDTSPLWVAEQAGRLVWAILPIVSPGRTMLLMCPGGSRRPAAAALPLINAVCDHYRQHGVHLAQVLIDPSATAVADAFRELEFQQMAELLYMQRPIHPGDAFAPPQSVDYVSYRTDIDHLFRSTILATYEQSLDCPALNGMRSMSDIMSGHRATGEFDPKLWTLMRINGQPVGVTLLNRQPFADTVELVYFGLVPQARGQGLGDIAMQHVLTQAMRSGMLRLVLAVDSINTPAIQLYKRAGLVHMGSKLALLRDLRNTYQPV